MLRPDGDRSATIERLIADVRRSLPLLVPARSPGTIRVHFLRSGRDNMRAMSTRQATTTTTRILLADDHEAVRAALRAVLEAEAGFDVVAEAADGLAAVRLVTELSPDVVVMDLRMPGLGGVEATRQAVAAAPAVRVVVISAYADGHTARQALAAGAAGYVLKDHAFEELAAAVRAVAGGATYLSPRVAAALNGERVD